jgi:methylmalonyl-CoA/ethylmalonyl-CoA epimerase
MMQKIEHLGIAVKNLEESVKTWTHLLGEPAYKTEEVAGEMVRTAFFRMGESKIELLEATSPESAIAKFIEKKGEGIHHIAFGVQDLKQEAERLKTEGFRALNTEPKAGADHKWVMFFHPKETGGVLIEICQDREG